MTPAKSAPFPFVARVMFTAAAALLTGCERIPEKVEISDTREISKHDPLPSIHVAPADRLEQSLLLTIHPQGWVQLPAPSPQISHFNFGENLEGDFSVSVLESADDSDFITPNVNRWRTQMGQPPLEQAEILALPRIRMLGKLALKVAIDGSYTPVGATEPQPGYRLLGAILQTNSVTFFAKMTGPQALVESQEKTFDRFVQSAQLRPSPPMR